jgi:TRAP-type C4-dicarboxylate transport system substrate-binding protein
MTRSGTPRAELDVETGSKGGLEVQLYFQDALGNPQSAIKNLETGSLALYSGALDYYAPLAAKELGVISLPFLLRN